MLTKKNLKKWLNIALLVGTLACIVAVAAMERLSLGEKGALALGYLAALKAILPTLKGEAEAVIDKSSIPDDDTTEAETKPIKPEEKNA